MTTLKEIVEETEGCYRRIRELLMLGRSRGGNYSTVWKACEQGTIGFHVDSARYKLEELI